MEVGEFTMMKLVIGIIILAIMTITIASNKPTDLSSYGNGMKPDVKKGRVDKMLCVFTCVKNLKYKHDRLDGTAILELTKLCEAKFKILDCCESSHMKDYYTICRD